jgi:hypothetical protein
MPTLHNPLGWVTDSASRARTAEIARPGEGPASALRPAGPGGGPARPAARTGSAARPAHRRRC